MTLTHHAAVAAAILVALVIFYFMIFGSNIRLTRIANSRSARDVAIALWAFLLPAWFTIEDQVFGPPPGDTKYVEFHKGQEVARYLWTVVAGVIAIIIGASAPSLPENDDAPKPADQKRRPDDQVQMDQRRKQPPANSR
jgi:hypothetical protein